MKYNHRCVKLVKKYEGCSFVPYNCPGGKKTVGVGHVILEGESHLLGGVDLKQATELLYDDLDKALLQLKWVTDRELKVNQVNALVSFIFNLGIGNYQSSTLKTLVDNGDDLNVPAEMIKWRLGTGRVLRGLLLRRLDEAKLYIS